MAVSALVAQQHLERIAEYGRLVGRLSVELEIAKNF